MTIEEKRESLRKFCREQESCSECFCISDAEGNCFSGSDDLILKNYDRVFPRVPASTTIKDSGDRTAFDSGAVRDMHEGKGRFDLLPMCVLLRLAKHYEAGCVKYGERNWEKGIPCHSYADSAFRHLVKYMDGYSDEDHLIAAVWNLCCLAWTEEKKPELMDIPARMELTKNA